MTTKATKAGKPSSTLAVLILFGRGSDGRGQAGKFNEPEAEKAAKAAKHLGLSVLPISDEQTRSLANQLSLGSIHATGRGLVPYVSKARFEDVLQIAKAHSVEIANGERSTLSDAKPATSQKSSTGHHLPASWQVIQPGDLVLSQDSDPAEGWWKAIVVKRHGEMISLKWLQHQRPRRLFLKHVYTLGLIWPGIDLSESASDSKELKAGFPRSWAAIAPEHTCLAPESGPMQQSWEAVVIKAAGDDLTLRWRDYDGLPEFTRSRFELALFPPAPSRTSGKPTK